jgi:hypothetical protein
MMEESLRNMNEEEIKHDEVITDETDPQGTSIISNEEIISDDDTPVNDDEAIASGVDIFSNCKVNYDELKDKKERRLVFELYGKEGYRRIYGEEPQ